MIDFRFIVVPFIIFSLFSFLFDFVLFISKRKGEPPLTRFQYIVYQICSVVITLIITFIFLAFLEKFGFLFL